MKTMKLMAIMAVVATVLTGCNKKSYLSEDLRLRDLYGNVESVTMNDKTEIFDEKGINVTPGLLIERDDQNRIVKCSIEDGADVGDMWFEETYEYSEDGNVFKYHKSNIYNEFEATCIYDRNGHLVKMFSNGYYEDGGEWTRDISYSILETDAHGNWIKRNAHTILKEVGLKEESDIEETREITYRK